jgi:hypothetical protein
MAMEGSNGKKVAIAVVLLALAGGFAYSRMQKLTPSAAINNGQSEDYDPAQQADFKKIAEAAKITPEQQKKLDTARENRDFGAMRDILTTDQRKIMAEQFQARRAGQAARRAAQETKAKAALGEEQYKRYQEKRQEMRSRWGGGQRGGGNRQGGNTSNSGGPRT